MKNPFIVICVVVVLAILGVGLLWPLEHECLRCSHGFAIELETPGGPLPIQLSYHRSHTVKDGWVGSIRNGYAESIDVIIELPKNNHDEVIVKIPHYDSHLQFKRNEGGKMEGVWSKARGEGRTEVLIRSADRSFVGSKFESVAGDSQPADFEGLWSVKFESSDELAIGDFWTMDLDEYTIANGTFLTTTGDYRYLSGRVDGNLMRLSTFDGAHAFLFHARMQADGSIEGDFYSGNWHHETWTAVRDDDAKLPDAFEQTVIADEEALAEAVFKDLEGEPTRVLDVLDESNDGRGAKARIIEIFGTWCPNCSDAGRELVALKEQYGDDLAIVGLAFEITEDFDRSVVQVRRHHEHIGSDWPILIAGLSDKDKATAALGFLDQVRSYPTLVFLNEANEVQAVYSGFSGPATGDAYIEQRERFEALIDGMIEE